MLWDATALERLERNGNFPGPRLGAGGPGTQQGPWNAAGTFPASRPAARGPGTLALERSRNFPGLSARGWGPWNAGPGTQQELSRPLERSRNFPDFPGLSRPLERSRNFPGPGGSGTQQELSRAGGLWNAAGTFPARAGTFPARF